jgi:two-component system sensor histidine kinase NreB
MSGWFAEMVSSTESYALLESIFTNVSDAIMVVNKEGLVIGVNTAMEKMSGWSTDELVGKRHLCEICVGMATCREDLTCTECFFQKSQVPSFEMRVRTKDGDEFPVAASSTRLPDDAKASMVLIMRDMTEQHQTERERNRQKLTNYVIHAQEEERKRISRELHDGVGQALYSILVGLNVVGQQELNEQTKNLLTNVQELTARALEEVKRMAVELRPTALDDLGLLPAIRSYIKRYEQTFGIEVTLQVKGSQRRYPASVETALYRILQEAMTNTAKYADAETIHITFMDDGEQLTLTVSDDGKGFDIQHLEAQGTGLGLFGMKERAHLLDGTVEIHAAIGAGTRILVTIPLRKEEANRVYSHSDLG